MVTIEEIRNQSDAHEFSKEARKIADNLTQYLTLSEFQDTVQLRTVMMQAINILDDIVHCAESQFEPK